jgi:hypothetical protein
VRGADVPVLLVRAIEHDEGQHAEHRLRRLQATTCKPASSS